MMIARHVSVVVALLGPLVAFAPGASAAEPRAAESFAELLECRTIADPQARLACYDQHAKPLADARARKEIVVTDKAEVDKARRKMFGFSLPQSTILGEDGDAGEVKRLETKVVAARRGRDGAWVVTLADAGTWEQVDSKPLALSPKAGQKAVVTKGSLGSYFVSIDGQSALKMRRVQ